MSPSRTQTQTKVIEGPTSIRRGRIRAFLLTHAALAGIGLIVAAVETTFGLQPTVRRQLFSWGVAGVIGLFTLVGFWFFRRGRGMTLLIPLTLAMDSLVVILQLFQEGDFETAWTGTPLMLLFMLPLFSDRPRAVWALAGFQLSLFLGLLYARNVGWLPYDVRTHDPVGDWDFAMFSWEGFVVAVVGATLLAGRTSVDVLNSQRQLTDVLERQEKELAVANARIVQQEKLVSIGQLTAGVAHEINNPLTFVQTNLASLRRDMMDLLDVLDVYQTADARLAEVVPETYGRIVGLRDALCLDDPRESIGELLEDTTEGLARVQMIIRDLKVFARLDEAERNRVDVREGLRSTLKILGKSFGDRGIVVDADLREVPEIEVYAALLNQVFVNILQNAIDACPAAGGRVGVRTHATEDAVIVEVTDNGPGVPMANRERVFDPFYTTKDVGEGTGLGLSLSLDIVTKHQGRIDVSDAPQGTGAVFSVVVPRVLAGTTTAAGAPASAGGPSGAEPSRAGFSRTE